MLQLVDMILKVINWKYCYKVVILTKDYPQLRYQEIISIWVVGVIFQSWFVRKIRVEIINIQ